MIRIWQRCESDSATLTEFYTLTIYAGHETSWAVWAVLVPAAELVVELAGNKPRQCHLTQPILRSTTSSCASYNMTNRT